MENRISPINDKIDVNWYDATYRAFIPNGMTASQHYREHGERMGFYKNPQQALASDLFDRFDPAWYLSTYKDVAESGKSPWYHYFVYGYREGRRANEVEGRNSKYQIDNFDPHWYAQKYADVSAAGVDPIEHYLLYGRGEGRAPNAQEAERLKNKVHKPNIELAFTRIIGRSAEPDELEYWSEQMLHGLAFEKFFNKLAAS